MNTWAERVDPLIQRLEVAGKFNGTASWNADGSDAFAKLLRTMVKVLDEQVIGRREGKADGKIIAREMRLFGATVNDMPKEHVLLVAEYLMLGGYRTTDQEVRREELRIELRRIVKEMTHG